MSESGAEGITGLATSAEDTLAVCVKNLSMCIPFHPTVLLVGITLKITVVTATVEQSGSSSQNLFLLAKQNRNNPSFYYEAVGYRNIIRP